MKRYQATFLVCLLAALPATAQLAVSDVQHIIAQAVTRAKALTGNPLATNAVIAISDREGWILGVWAINTNLAPNDANVGNAISKAGAAAFLSSDNNAFSSRTAGFIVQQHYPPGIDNTPPGPLVGVNFSQLAFSDINKFKGPGSRITFGSSPGTNIVATPLADTGGLAGTPGGLPLYQNGLLVGGIGVSGDGSVATDVTPSVTANPSSDEDVALAGQTGYTPANDILGSDVFVGGIRLAYVASTTSLGTVHSFTGLPGGVVMPFTITNSPAPYPYPVITFGNETGQIRQPIIDDPATIPLPNSVARLSAADVTNIIVAAATRAYTTRAGIRLPLGKTAEVFITVVNNPNNAGSPPIVLGTFCTSSNATRFSWDVAVQKARTAVFFSATNRAYSCRTVGFLAEQFYPPGIDGTEPGIFLGLQERFSIITSNSIPFTNTLNGASIITTNIPDPNLPNGITIFPGGFPLYRNGVLIGAIGVSGDGVDQDDLISASGAAVFLAPVPIRADQTQYRGARLPFAKFPRNPAL